MWERILVDEIIKATYLNLLYQLGFFSLESCMPMELSTQEIWERTIHLVSYYYKANKA